MNELRSSPVPSNLSSVPCLICPNCNSSDSKNVLDMLPAYMSRGAGSAECFLGAAKAFFSEHAEERARAAFVLGREPFARPHRPCLGPGPRRDASGATQECLSRNRRTNHGLKIHGLAPQTFHAGFLLFFRPKEVTAWGPFSENWLFELAPFRRRTYALRFLMGYMEGALSSGFRLAHRLTVRDKLLP